MKLTLSQADTPSTRWTCTRTAQALPPPDTVENHLISIALMSADGKIKLWLLKPIRMEEQEADAAVPKQLCALTGHTSQPVPEHSLRYCSTESVNCVRWAPDARYLASCSDDKLVLLWEKVPGA